MPDQNPAPVRRPSGIRGRARRLGAVALNPWVGLVLLGLVALVMGVLVARDAVTETSRPGPYFGFHDMRDTMWLPSRDLFAGNDPYDLEAYLTRHPGAQEFSLYAPLVLLLSAPLALLPLGAAIAVWALCLGGFFLLLSRLALTAAGIAPRLGAVTLLTVAVLLTPAGRQAFASGQFATVCVVAAVAACVVRREWVGVLAVVVALVKPQVGLPLLLVLVATGQVRRAVTGLGVAVVASLPVAGYLTWRAGGLLPWVETLLSNLSEAFGAPTTSAARPDSTRIDLPGMLSRWGVDVSATGTALLGLVGLAVTALALAWVWRHPSDDRLVQWARVSAAATGVFVLSTPNELYAYPIALPAVVAGVALVVGRRGRTRWEGLAGIVLLVPFVHLSTVDRLVGLPDLTVVNGVVIAIGSVMLPVAAALRERRTAGAAATAPG